MSKCVVPNPPCPQAVSSQGQPSESRKARVERAAGVLANKSFSKVKQDESCGHLWPLIFFDLRSLSLWKLGKCPLKQCSLDISVDTYLHDHACMMYVICHVYLMAEPIIYPSFLKIRHLTVEIHNSHIQFHTTIWSTPVRQHCLSFLAADFAHNKEQETLQKQNKRVLRDPRDIQICCLVNKCWINYSDLKNSPLRDATSISWFGKHLSSCANRMT